MHGLALFLYMGVKYSLMKSLSQHAPSPCNPIQYQVDKTQLPFPLFPSHCTSRKTVRTWVLAANFVH